MPRLTVWMIRSALLHLGVGFIFGALMLWEKGMSYEPRVWRLRSPHIELVLLGWTLQLAMGVAFWIMPRFSGPQRYGREWLFWMSFSLINVGVIAVAAGPWLGTELAFWGRVAEVAAAACFGIGIWPRIKALGA